MANNASKIVTVIGGSGFVGRALVRSLAKRGYRVRVACRRPDLAGSTVVSGTPGQIVPVQVNLRYPDSVVAACDGAFAVVNLVSTLYNAGSQSFEALNVFGAEASARAASKSSAAVFIQVSAIGADLDSKSEYSRTKAEGEKRAAANFSRAIIVRPSIIFGPEDNFFNQFAKMARFSPALPLIGGDTKFQPVFVGDVADAIATLIDKGEATGKTYELGGPEAISFKALLQYILDTVQRKRILLPLPWGVAKAMGAVLGILPKPVITMDQVELLKSDNLVSATAQADGRDLAGLGIAPKSFRSIVPSYLYRFRAAGQFTTPSVTPE